MGYTLHKSLFWFLFFIMSMVRDIALRRFAGFLVYIIKKYLLLKLDMLYCISYQFSDGGLRWWKLITEVVILSSLFKDKYGSFCCLLTQCYNLRRAMIVFIIRWKCFMDVKLGHFSFTSLLSTLIYLDMMLHLREIKQYYSSFSYTFIDITVIMVQSLTMRWAKCHLTVHTDS